MRSRRPAASSSTRPQATNPTDAQSRADYFDSMYHCSAVLGVCTTAFLEATIVDRPVHSVLVGEYASTQSGLPQFQVMRPENRGMLALSDSIEELAQQLAASLGDPGTARARNRVFRDQFLRPFGEEQAASPRLVREIERLPTVPRIAPADDSMPLRLAGRTVAFGVRAYAAHMRRKAELEEIGGARWREQFTEMRQEDKALKRERLAKRRLVKARRRADFARLRNEEKARRRARAAARMVPASRR